MIRPRLLLFSLAFGLSLGLLGCGQPLQVHPTAPASSVSAENESQSPAQEETLPLLPASRAESGSCTAPAAVRLSERNRAACYHLQPARTVVISTKKQHTTTQKSAKIATRKSLNKGKRAKGKKTRTVVRTVGRCQPQSLIYARCRTGIKTCRLGDTSPVQWFACARKNGATSSLPLAGSVIVLDANTRRGMPTGHPAYVEEAGKNSDGTWTLRISHTNYDRKCHLDLDAEVIFYPTTMTASFASGHWSAWAKHLKVLGFILH